MTATDLDEFTLAYIEAALWSSTDDDDHPLDDRYSADDIAPECLERMAKDCAAFQGATGGFIDSAPRVSGEYSNREMAGHDFWLTRNGHGAGFWDGDWPEGDTLTAACRNFPEVDLYIGDDGRIHA